jgi:acyl carrier protein
LETKSKNLEKDPYNIKKVVLEVLCEKINTHHPRFKKVTPEDLHDDLPLAKYGLDSLDKAEAILEVEIRTGVQADMLRVSRGDTETAGEILSLFQQ